MFKIEESTIYLTRGDSALIKLTLYDANGDLYTPAPADKIRKRCLLRSKYRMIP